MEPMLKFKVWFDRLTTGFVEVEAESREAAIEGNIDTADIVWTDTHISVAGAEEIE